MGPFLLRPILENAPDEVGEEGEDGEHEDSADPDEEVHGHFGIVDLFFVHVEKVATRGG